MTTENGNGRRPVAYSYVRASTGKQVMSPEQQKEGNYELYKQEFATLYGWGDHFVDPATSGRKTSFLKRPAGRELDSRLERGDVVIVAKFDRAFRNLRDFLFMQDLWRDRGIELRIRNFFGVDSRTNAGKMICSILAAVAEFEAEMAAERTREMKKHQKKHEFATNQYAGYGFKPAGPKGKKKRVPDPEERGVMAWIVKQHLDRYTWRDMYLTLLERGVKTRRGKEWSIARIRRAVLAEYLLRAQEEATKLGVSVASP
jgi:DNA invertase Pin-like site-specific DNA recombinase